MASYCGEGPGGCSSHLTMTLGRPSAISTQNNTIHRAWRLPNPSPGFIRPFSWPHTGRTTIPRPRAHHTHPLGVIKKNEAVHPRMKRVRWALLKHPLKATHNRVPSLYVSKLAKGLRKILGLRDANGKPPMEHAF